MIKCNNICKSFGRQIVLDGFSHVFNDTGLYLLFGESGSGKTTFLNILSGFKEFDSGTVSIDDNVFSDVVNRELIREKFDYITQDAFFVDFLTVMDNLRIIKEDDTAIIKLLEKFGLEDKMNRYPTTLSGGERQRLAIVRALLGNKKILFMDEPTASLDRDNKIQIFELLATIKSKVLIICSSHDAKAKEYADEVVEFKKCREVLESEPKNTGKITRQSIRTGRRSKNNKVHKYINKWFKSQSRNRKSAVLFGVFLTIAMCICMLADTPKNKMDSNIEYVYKMNMCELVTYNEEDGMYDKLCEIDNISEVILKYNGSVPSPEGNQDSVFLESPEYELVVDILPYSKETFKISDTIKYGTYFTDVNQVVISHEYAEEISPGNPQAAVGQTVSSVLYGLGETEFEIVGVFDEFNKFEDVYFNAATNSYSWFANSKLTEQFLDNPDFYDVTNGKKVRRYNLYFKSYRDMKNFYEENYEKFEEQGHWLNMTFYLAKEQDVFIMMFRTLLPLSVFVAFFTIIFYINIIKTEIAYNNKFFAVFDYAGYSLTKVRNSFIMLNLCHLLRTGVIAAVITFIITFLINLINQKYVFVGFQIFTYNIGILAGFVIFMGFVSVISTNLLLRRLKITGWYENIISNRDLI